MREGNKSSVVSILVSIVFLAWFLASIGAMIYFSRNNQGALIVTVFGQYFLVFGIIAIISGIKGKKFQPVTILFPVVGIGCMVGGCIFQFGSETVIKYANDILPYVFLVAFMIVGAAVVIGAYFSSKKKHEVCTYCITATVVDVKTHYRKGTRSYCPVYETYFRDETIRLCNNVFTNMRRVEVGETREIYLNPNQPTEFFEPKEEKATRTFAYVLGSMFVIASAFGLFMFVFG